jgi:hypothetical protein
MGDSRLWVGRYMAEGWSVVPIPPGEKGPRVPNRQNTTFKEEDFGAEDRLGDPSSGLVDVDLDAQEAIAAARSLLSRSRWVCRRVILCDGKRNPIRGECSAGSCPQSWRPHRGCARVDT